MFIYGFYMWNASWERAPGDLQDAPPKQTPTQLPVVHLTFWKQSERPAGPAGGQGAHGGGAAGGGAGAGGAGPSGLADYNRALETFSCPVFASRHSLQLNHALAAQPVLHIDMRHEGINAQRWSLRGVIATLRPF